MKILVFSPVSLEYGRGGEISTLELASGLSEFYDVSLIDTSVLPGKKSLSRDKILKKTRKIRKLATIYFATIHIFGRVLTFPYPREIKRLFNQIRNSDIVYFSISTIKTSLIFLLAKLIYRKVHFIIGYRKPFNIDKLLSLFNLKYRINICLLSLFKKRIFHHALSIHAKNFLENFYNPQKVIHITHGIEVEAFRALNIKKNDNYLNFIYIGHFDDEHKGVNVLLKGIKLFLIDNKGLPVRFEFCGKGPLESNIRSLEKEFPNHIIFSGYIEHNQILKYYGKNDVFLFTSRVEPFPRTIMEALAGRLLILASKTIGSIELLLMKDFGFFLSNLKPEDIKQKLIEIYKIWKHKPERIRSLQKGAQRYVFNNYTIEKEIEGFRELIRQIKKHK